MMHPGSVQCACAHCTEARTDFELLYRRWRRLVRAWAEQHAGATTAVDAEDVSQEVFTEVWHQGAAARCRRPGSDEVWLLSVTTSKAAEALRAADQHDRPVAGVGDLHREQKQPDATEQVIDRLWLASVIQRLPNEQRAVLYLTYFQDLSQQRIADRLGLPLGTVKSHSRRALRALVLGGVGRRPR